MITALKSLRPLVALALVFVALLPHVSAQQTEFLQTHNNARLSVNPPAANMPLLVWSDTLAAIAQAYAQTCPTGHSGRAGVGENLFFTTNQVQTASQLAIEAVTLWNDERADYSFETNTCAAGKVCGHYTQIVWNTTTEVGCGISSAPCNGLLGAGTRTVVCNYNPPGNIVGRRPYAARVVAPNPAPAPVPAPIPVPVPVPAPVPVPVPVPAPVPAPVPVPVPAPVPVPVPAPISPIAISPIAASPISPIAASPISPIAASPISPIAVSSLSPIGDLSSLIPEEGVGSSATCLSGPNILATLMLALLVTFF